MGEMEEVYGIYEEFIDVKRELDTSVDLLELVLLNGKNEDVNKYIRKALPELKRALSYMSDAEFELYTSPPEMFEG